MWTYRELTVDVSASAPVQELTELRKEVDRVHAENDKLKNSIQVGAHSSCLNVPHWSW